jgi:hypothetical protein
MSNHRQQSAKIDDDDDDDDDDNARIEAEQIDEPISNARERRFRDFASIEYNGDIYMVG